MTRRSTAATAGLTCAAAALAAPNMGSTPLLPASPGINSATSGTQIELIPGDTCLGAGETQLIVEILVSGQSAPTVGGQFFLDYDESLIEFVDTSPGDAPFTREIYEAVDEINGEIDYAVGVPDGAAGTSAAVVAARLTFDVLGDFCSVDELVSFRPGALPPSLITDDQGNDLGADLFALPTITADATPPGLTTPVDTSVNADAGGCNALIDFLDPSFDQEADNETDVYGYYYAMTGSLFDARLGGLPNGDNGQGGTMRFIHDDPVNWASYATNDWIRDDWFTDTASLAVTLLNDNAIVYDNNGIELGDPGGNYDYAALPSGSPASDYPLLFRGYAMRNNFDWTYAGLFYLDAPTEIDEIACYFDASAGLDPNDPALGYRVNIYSAVQEGTSGGGVPHYMPGADSFIGDVLSSSSTPGTISVTDSGVDRVLPGWLLSPPQAQPLADDIFRLGFTLDTPVTLQPGFYFIAHHAVIGGPDTPVASDNCGVALAPSRSDGLALTDPFPQGDTTITWTATDPCGNETIAMQEITVEPENSVSVAVELAATDAGPFERCIEFAFTPAGGGPAVITSETLSFSGGVAQAIIEIPCGDYTCVTARDPLHSLRKTDGDDFADAGAIYTADFLAGPGDNDGLIGGNLNGDAFIDILDFGAFIAEYGTTPGADTPCGTPAVHADISGDGAVDAADFTFIQINYFMPDEPLCPSPAPLPADAPDGPPDGTDDSRPTGSISTAELAARGMGHLAAGDLNGDGLLDQADIAAFLGGARPARLADLNGDGAIDVTDLGMIADAIRNGDAAGDVNRDGVLDLADLVFAIERVGATE